jgi:hypothetical protein
MTPSDLMTLPQYSLPQAEKERRLTEGLAALDAQHRAACDLYARVVASLFPGAVGQPQRLSDLPFVPVGLFKSHRLASVPDDQVFKVLTSSGTTGDTVSRIYLDRETAQLQSEALAAIMATILGPSRLPAIFVDWPGVIRDRASFSARGAGIVGMMTFARSVQYLLDDTMRLDVDALRAFLAKHGDAPFLIFGFTFMVWQHLLKQVEGLGLDLSNGILVHSGGWKALQAQAVDDAAFKRAFLAETGLHRIHSFYGMVEQVGSVFLEGHDGLLHPPNFADVIVRDPVTWEEVPNGEPGVLQVLSLLPHSYPGHSILTEDLGVVQGVDDDPNGWLGKRFSVLGRVPKAQLRGCSDTYAASAQPEAMAGLAG